MNLDATDQTIQATADAMQLAGLLDDRFGHSDDARVAAWAEQIERHRLERDDLLDAVQAFYDQPRDRPIGIGDLTDTARAIRRDRLQREDDAEREQRQKRQETKTGRDIAAAFAAATGPTTNRTPRLVSAENALRCCHGKRESLAAIREHLAAKTEVHTGTHKIPIDHDKARLAQTVRCTWCHAQPAAPCTSVTGRTPAGGYHPTRYTDATKADI